MKKISRKIKGTGLLLLTLIALGGCGQNIQAKEPGKAPQATFSPVPTDSPQATFTPTPTSTPTPSPTSTPTPSLTNTPTPTPVPLDITICFSGDISLADDAVTTKQWMNSGEDLSKCISPELLEIMNGADVMCVNNEFTFSTRGKPMKGKAYTFRARPERVALLQEMGVDLALLANNHVFDYGKESILDTFATLEAAGIGYFGAGRNLSEAMKPYYVELDGITIAFVAASRAEKNKMTPQATEEEPGILRCYDTELFLEVIKEAEDNADIVLACVHWGTEYSTVLEEAQLTTGKAYLDAGADVIIGSHSHCLQGMEFYDGKPIVYSLGNFWFNVRTLDTMLLQVRITGERTNPEIEIAVVPALQSGNCTTYVSEPEQQQQLYQYLESISINVDIDANGIVTESAFQ